MNVRFVGLSYKEQYSQKIFICYPGSWKHRWVMLPYVVYKPSYKYFLFGHNSNGIYFLHETLFSIEPLQSGTPKTWRGKAVEYCLHVVYNMICEARVDSTQETLPYSRSVFMG